MHDVLHQWAAEFHVHPNAVATLLQRLGVGFPLTLDPSIPQGATEAAVSQRVRLAAAEDGTLTWRNNVGAMQDESGRVVRYGLCNDTAELNRKIKSADLIGIKPVLIGPQHVGRIIGQFWSREVKRANWSWTGNEHEVAQARWMELILSKGGDAALTNGGSYVDCYGNLNRKGTS